jgi:adenylate cyclase
MSPSDQTSEKPSAPCVLVVDDDPSIRRLIAAALRRNGMSVEVAEGGSDAIEKLSGSVFSLITLDLMMPSVSGWDVIEWLRFHPERRPRSVLVISAADREVFQRLDPVMVNAVFLKPFDLDVLLGYVDGAVRQRDRRRARIIGTA